MKSKKLTRTHKPVRLFPGESLCWVPRRHVVLGLGLAQLADSRGHPLGVEVPAAHLAWSGAAVVGLRLLNREESVW